MRSDTHTSAWNGTYKRCTLIMCVCVCRSRVRDGEMDTDMPNARGKRETPVTGWFHYALRIPHVNE